MKNFILSALIILIVQFSYAQNDTITSAKEKDVFMIVEFMPVWNACESIKTEEKRVNCTTESIKNFIAENLIYPVNSKQNEIVGTVYVTFVINPVGNVSNVRVLRGINEELDTEALRIVTSMPQFKPGLHRGKPVAVQYTLPIKFSLREK